MSAIKSRSSCSFPNILLSCLNFVLFILSAASFIPIVLLSIPPFAQPHVAHDIVHVFCLLLRGLLSKLISFSFMTHVSILVASLSGEVLSVMALLAKETPSLSQLRLKGDPKEAKVPVMLECAAFMLMELALLVLTCTMHSCWVKEYERLGADMDAVEKKQSMTTEKVQEESMANAAEMAKVKAKGLDERMRSKYMQWVETDFEG